MTPRLGGKAPAPGSGGRAEGPGIGAGTWRSGRRPGRSGRALACARGMWGAGAHLRNDKLPTIGSGDVQNPP